MALYRRRLHKFSNLKSYVLIFLVDSNNIRRFIAFQAGFYPFNPSPLFTLMNCGEKIEYNDDLFVLLIQRFPTASIARSFSQNFQCKTIFRKIFIGVIHW